MMFTWLEGIHPVLQALIATLFTWGVTALGAATVFVTRTVNKKLLQGMLGFAAGVMVAASFWSLLAPAIEMAEASGLPAWLPAVVGFLAGGAFLYAVDRLLPHLHIGLPLEETEGLKTTWKRSVLLVLAITLHNFPEGLAVGVAFGAVAAGLPSANLAGAVALAIGIGLQNFPEGLAVSMPLRGEGLTRLRAFALGQATGLVEPIAGVLGAAAVLAVQPILPYALAFAAGAMIYVVVEELIPESQRDDAPAIASTRPTEGRTDIATLGAMGGFAIMMLLDVALG
jgi:ZIP family zinc transporter